jgi:hypothetical protein
VAVAEFPEASIYPFGATVHDMVKAGFLRACSVGFRALEYVQNAARGGLDFKRQELLEWSICPVGALPDALAIDRGADVSAVKAWLGRGGDVVLEIADDEPVLEVTEELYRVAMAAAAQARSRPTAAELAGLAGWRGAHHRDDLIDIDPRLLAHAIADVAREAVADIVRGETERTINRLRGRVD